LASTVVGERKSAQGNTEKSNKKVKKQ